MDFGKFKYEADMKAREARRNQANTVLKEIRFRLKIDPHDYGTKKGHVERFLSAGDKVKVMIMFRGREQSRPEMGVRLLQRLADDVAELGFIESMPKQDGRNMIMVLGPTKKKADAKSEQRRKTQEAQPAKAERTERPVVETDDTTDRPDFETQVAEAQAQVAAEPAPTAPAAPVEPEPTPEPAAAVEAPVEKAAPVKAPAPAKKPAPVAEAAPAEQAPSAKVDAPSPAAPKPAPKPATPRPMAKPTATPRPATPRPATPRPAAKPAPKKSE